MFVRELSPEVISRISAGEVLEGPTDCVKELIENSLDANASRVKVEIVKGGKRYISVLDDGTGIHPEDLPLVIRNHTTSKIASFEDIFKIPYYGFRGEALHSIASVSRLVIRSKHYTQEVCYELKAEGGRVCYVRPSACSAGTQVEVYDLFYNLPVRRKFLRKEDTERKKIVELIKVYAMARPDVSFELISDGKRVLFLPRANSYRERLEELFGERFEERLVEDQYIRVRSLISVEPSKAQVYFFVNSRPVYNRELLEFIRGRAGKAKVVIFLEVPPYLVDTNVHPKKREVKFYKEGIIKELISEAFERRHISVLAQPKERYGEKFEVLGSIDDTIAVVRIGDFIYFFDQHLLSERENYEKGMVEDMACRSSIKAGHKLTKQQIESLVKKWFSFENKETCPHGRPLYYRIYIGDVYKKLGRSF